MRRARRWARQLRRWCSRRRERGRSRAGLVHERCRCASDLGGCMMAMIPLLLKHGGRLFVDASLLHSGIEDHTHELSAARAARVTCHRHLLQHSNALRWR